MKRQYFYLLIIVFLFFNSILVYYVSNYSIGTRNPIWTYTSRNEITCFDISASGNSLIIGDSNGSVIYFSGHKLLPWWTYQCINKPIFLKSTLEGDYFVMMDDRDNIYLFSNSPFFQKNEVIPRWTSNLRNGKVMGIHSTGGIPPLVYILVAIDGKIQLVTNKEDLIWEFQTDAEEMKAVISSDGRIIAAADSNGDIFLFDITSNQPFWRSTTELNKVCIGISASNEFLVVGGTNRNGRGEIYLFSISPIQLSWHKELEKHISAVNLSYDGSRIITDNEDGSAYVIYPKEDLIDQKSFNIEGGLAKIYSPSYGSYLLSLNPQGDMFFFYIPRNTPLWKYETGIQKPLITISSTGDRVFIATVKTVSIISNTFSTDFIPGSRLLWGIVFLVGSLETIFVLIMIKDKNFFWDFIKKNYVGVLFGFTMGVIFGIFYLKTISGTLIICGIGCAIGSFFGFKKDGFLNFAVGCFSGLFGSIISGGILGLILWISGVENNIIILILGNSIEGGKLGVLFGPLGVILGYFFNFFSKTMEFVKDK